MTYKLHTDNPYWVKATFNEEMEKLKQEVGDIYEDQVGYYWITSTEREELLKVADFIDGEDIITELTSDEGVNTFEEAVEKYQYAEIQEERPPN